MDEIKQSMLKSKSYLYFSEWKNNIQIFAKKKEQMKP